MSKRLVKWLLISAETAFVPPMIRLARALGFFRPVKDSVLVLPCCPQDKGSLGDLAALESIALALTRKEGRRVDLLRFRPDAKQIEVLGFTGEIRPSRDLRYERIGNWIRLCVLLSKYDKFYAWGADVLNGEYTAKGPLAILKTVRLASFLGLETRILGFSWRKTLNQEIFQRILGLKGVGLYLRDPQSKERFERQTHHATIQVADVAFLFRQMEPISGVQSIAQWLDEQARSSRVVLGVNTSLFSLGIKDQAEAQTKLGILCEALERARDDIPNLSVLPFPHDLRESPDCVGDWDLADLLRHRLNKRSFPESPGFPKTLNPSEVDYLAGRCDAVLTGRMHLAIAALRSTVPILCMPYQKKFEGMLQLFGLEDCVLSEHETSSPAEMGERVKEFITNRERLRERIRCQLPAVVDLAERNFT